jgi:hypothetical protein
MDGLHDISPDGKTLLLSRGILVGSRRDSRR